MQKVFSLVVYVLVALLLSAQSKAQVAEVGTGFETLYRVTLLRAEPGNFTTLLNDIANRAKRNKRYHVLRHSQGDHWDLMTLEPLGSYSDWFDKSQFKRHTLDAAWREHLDRLVVHRSEWFVYGPDADVVAESVNNHGLYHIEMFRARAGHKNKLLQQRAMENSYLSETGQVANLVFKGDQGGDWDVMTIGFHKSLQSFAQGSSMSPEEKDKVARKNGFKSVSDIGPYLRSLIESHNDTLAVSIR